MTSLDQTAKLGHTISILCNEILQYSRLSKWNEMNEEELLLELVTAILGSQVSSVLATAAAIKLHEERCLTKYALESGHLNLTERIEANLRQPLYNTTWGIAGRRYRFPAMRAQQIVQTMENIYVKHGSLKDILSDCSVARDTRGKLVRATLGIGPKQASLFLRNVGYTDELAVLDSHVLKYMGIFGMTNMKT